MIAQAVYLGFRIGEISCPTKYFDDASSINFSRSVTYGIGVLRTAFQALRLKRWGLARPVIFEDVPNETPALSGRGDSIYQCGQCVRRCESIINQMRLFYGAPGRSPVARALCQLW